MPDKPAPVLLQFGDFVLDPQQYTLRRGGELVPLQPKTFDLLHHLLQHPGRVVEKDELLAAVWPGVVVTEHSLTRCIKDLRRALGDDAAAPHVIETVARRGYRLLLTPSVRPAPAAQAAEPAPVGLPPVAAPPRRRTAWAAAGALLLLGAAVAGFWMATRQQAPAPVASIAVLPFNPLSAGDADSLFADGVAEDLLDRLAQLPRLQVVARTSSFAFRGEAHDAKAIGRTLGVRWLLEGSVRQDASRVIVNAQMVDAGSGYRVWSARFERAPGDLFALQDEIARSVAAQVQQRIEPGAPLPEAHRSAGVEAWQHYMLARELFNRRTQDWQPRALQALEQAVALEPGFARAQALLGIVLQLSAHNRAVPENTLVRAEQAVQRALQDDPRLGLAHAAAGLLRLQQGDHAGADTALQRALELDPMLVVAHNWRAIALTSQGRIAEADAQLQAGLRIDPLNPVLLGNVGVAHQRDGRPEEARKAYLRMLELPARPVGAYYSLLALDREHGRLADALRWALAIEGEGRPRWGALAAVPALPVLVALGLDDAALQRLQALRGLTVPTAVFRSYDAALLRLGRHAEVESAARAAEAGPARLPSWWLPTRAASLALRGQLPDALRVQASRSPAPSTLGEREQADQRLALAWALAREGNAAQRAAARQDIGEVVALADAGRLESSPDATAFHALAHALAGDTEGALARLELAQTGGFNDHRWLQHDPRWAVLHAQPRFQALQQAAQASAAAQRDEVHRRLAAGERDYAALEQAPRKP
jgi:TolB-like protein/DNA-binding winged helix-turn-helix (wHTH) protein/tetratricopeptide (TPR) repeat protein